MGRYDVSAYLLVDAEPVLKTDICICTRNRPDDLKACVDSILASEMRVNRIIVSDDSTDDRTRRVLDGYPMVDLLEGPRRGLGANRNNALKAVDGDLVVFLDDDARLDRYFLSLAEAYSDRKALDLRNTILTGYEITNGVEIRSNDQSFLGFQQRGYKAGDNLNTIVINSALIPANVAKTVGFDELLIYGFDEVDFAMRARAAGTTIIFCPELKNLHLSSPINRGFYSTFIDSSRLYVTFKRYHLLERNRAKAWLFLVAASAHLLAGNVKSFGFQGLAKTWKSLRKAGTFIRQFLAHKDYAPLSSRT